VVPEVRRVSNRSCCRVPVFCLLMACGAPGKTSIPAATDSVPLETLEAQVGYAHASWRIDPSTVNRVRFELRQILIAHDRATTAKMGFPFLADTSHRTRADALRLAVSLAGKLATHPAEFEKLATQWSDDRASREFAGALGTINATSLPMTVLDAFSVLKVGQISHVIESEFGFHIVQRLAVPTEQHVAARRILIQYRELPASLLEKAVTRARPEALKLAQQLRAQLDQRPDRFADLARQYSDAHDATDGGDIGIWSTHEGAGRSLASQVLAGLSVGAIAGPFETVAGYEIAQRTASTPRPRLLASFFTLEASTAGSLADTKATAFRLAEDLAKHPARFGEEQKKYCVVGDCTMQHWSLQRGRNRPADVDAVEKLAIGAVAKEPLDLGSSFMIIRRDDPSGLAALEEQYSYEMPAVEFVPLEKRLEQLDGEALAQGTLTVMQTAQASLGLDPTQLQQFRGLFQDLAHALQTAPVTDRAGLLAEHQNRVLALIGPPKWAAVLKIRDQLWHDAQLR
jgi:hypothetical protein